MHLARPSPSHLLAACPPAFYVRDNQVCSACHALCASGCTGPADSQCNTCAASVFLLQAGSVSRCVAACPSGCVWVVRFWLLSSY